MRLTPGARRANMPRMRITKVDWDRFWNDLGPHWCVEDIDQSPEDDSGLSPGDIITFSCGEIRWQGGGDPVPSELVTRKDLGRYGAPLMTVLRRWQRAQSHVTLAVEVPRDAVDRVRAALHELGCRVLA